jgi:hypothetical protein
MAPPVQPDGANRTGLPEMQFVCESGALRSYFSERGSNWAFTYLCRQSMRMRSEPSDGREPRSLGGRFSPPRVMV